MRVIRWLSLFWALAGQAQDDALEKGIAEFNRGQYRAAQSWLEKAPESAQRRTYIALTQAATGHCDAARNALAAEFEKAATQELGRLAGLALTQCQMAAGDYTAPVPVLARLRVLHPADADVLYQSARLHMKAWNETLFEMFQRTPNSYRVNQISAEIFEIQNRFAEAAAEYRKAIAKNPAALNLHFRLGRALLLESHAPEKLAQAGGEFEKELELNPGDAVAEYEIGQVLLTRQQPAEAATHLNRALGINPEFPEALETLAKLRMDDKQYSESVTLLERAVRLEPTSESAHYKLMLAYRNTGRTADAGREEKVLEKLRQAPQGEFSDFLKRLGEKAPKQ